VSAPHRSPARLTGPTMRYTRAPFATLALLAALALSGCGRTSSERPRPPASAPDTATAATPAAADSVAADSGATAPADSASAGAASTRAFTRFALTGSRAMAALRDSLGEDGLAVVLALNRVDLAHAREGDTLVVPAPLDSLVALSPFPATWPALDSLPKSLWVSLRVQAWAAYEHGRLARWGPTSTGRRTKPTPAGLYHTNWKQKQRLSTIDDSWLLRWYVNLESHQGVSFHEYELPGRPMSHSCVRLRPEDARWIHDWCDTWTLAPDRRSALVEGTPVAVFGAWAWGQRRPWRLLPEHPEACTLTPSELDEALHVLHDRVAPDFTTADSTRTTTR
jgi:hypothetical protein